MEDKNTITNGDVKTANKLKNLNPLPKSLDGLSEDEKQRIHDIRSKGGKARVMQLERQKTLKELANELLNAKVSKERAKSILGDIADDIADDSLTNGALLLARIFNECMENGTTKSAEFIRDTSGQSPTIRTETTINGMNDNDRELLQNIAERLSQNANKPRG